MIAPLRLGLAASYTTGSITVVNTSPSKMIMQTRVYRWAQDHGVDILTPTGDLIVGPPIFVIGPGEEQVMRVGLRAPITSDAEQTYRIVISEVPSTNQAQGLTFALHESLPIFVAPVGAAVASAEWSAKRSDVSHVVLTLYNNGNVHIETRALRLSSLESRGASYDAMLVKYVLPGQSTSWILKLPKPLEAGNVALEAMTDQGLLRATVHVSAP